MADSPGNTTITFGEPRISKRKYVCTTCSKAFKRSEHCIRHERRHTQEKPYNCKHCHKQYSRSDLLLRHQRTAHSSEQFQRTQKINMDLPSSPPASLHCSSIATDASPLAMAGGSHDRSLNAKHSISAEIDFFSEHHFAPEGMAKNAQQSWSLDQMQDNALENGNMDTMPVLDPFFDWSSEQIADFALPPLDYQLMEGFSPLEGLSGSAQGQNLSQDADDPEVCFNAQSSLHHYQEKPLERSNYDEPISEVLKPADCSVPQVVKHECTSTVIRFTKEMRNDLFVKLSTHVSHEMVQLLDPLGAVSFERCLQRYAEVFHTHVPMIHSSIFDFLQTPPPLVLAMSAIGAIYRMERKVAAILYNIAQQSLEAMELTRASPPGKILLQDWIRSDYTPSTAPTTPLWKSQAIFLLTLFEILSGDSELFAMAVERLGIFVSDFRTRLISLQTNNKNFDQMSWEAWIERESVKRLLYSYLYMCNLVSMQFGVTSGFSMLTDGKLEMPCHCSLWDATTTEQWQSLASIKGYRSPLTLKDAVSRLLNGTYPAGIPEQYWIWDSYSCNVAVNAVSIYISHMIQGSCFLGEGLISLEEPSPQRSTITAQMEAAISKCLLLFKQARARADDSYTWDETEGPLLYNSLAFLKVSYCKIMTAAESASRAMFFRENRDDFAASIQSFLSEPMVWNHSLTKAASVALESIMMPTKIGSLLVMKTAAFTWAIEHAFAGWDSILLLTKWLHVIRFRQREGLPILDTETHIIQRVCGLLAEEDDLIASKPSLAAALARSWAGYYDDTWVWGITLKMGQLLRELANRYEAEAVAG